MASIRRSLASMWDKADDEAPPPLCRADAKQGIDLDKVKILIWAKIKTRMFKNKSDR